MLGVGHTHGPEGDKQHLSSELMTALAGKKRTPNSHTSDGHSQQPGEQSFSPLSLYTTAARRLKMGATSSKAPTGIVTVSQRAGATTTVTVDPDIAALQRLPPVSPLVRPASLVQSALFSNRPDPSLPALHARNVSALCREYASLLRQAALPICEEQRTLSKKMSSVEALCSRVLYLMALRSTELTQSATSMRELGELRARTRDLQSAVQRSVARADALEARALTLAAAARGGAL